ncbi:MAG TPA: SRPBCC family protein [Ktedonobacterales bacterium]|nr:SRPBCC family protein [Ktedonobacterales bacterium]
MAASTKTEIIVTPGTQQILMSREFDAPRELVYRAYTDPTLLVRWLGPRRMAMTIDRYEVRDGGRWRYTHRDDNGEYGFHGVFHGDPSPERIVQTNEFEGMPGHVSLDTLTLEERDGKTLMRANSVFQSVEDRDGMVQSGMEEGFNESMERLDELLAHLKHAK